MYKKLLAYFCHIIDAKRDTITNQNMIAKIEKSHADVRIVDGVFQFTLYGLYTLLCNESDSTWARLHTYASFRSMVYASELNKDLSKFGYLVQVHYSTGKVDSSWYELVVLPHQAAWILD